MDYITYERLRHIHFDHSHQLDNNLWITLPMRD